MREGAPQLQFMGVISGVPLEKPETIEVSDEEVTWTETDRVERSIRQGVAEEVKGGGEAGVASKALQSFIELAEENRPDENFANRICEFAKRFGVLGTSPRLSPFSEKEPATRYTKRYRFHEPLKLWWDTAKQIRSMLNMSAALHQRNPINDVDIFILSELAPSFATLGEVHYHTLKQKRQSHIRTDYEKKEDEARELIEITVSEWLATLHLYPRLYQHSSQSDKRDAETRFRAAMTLATDTHDWDRAQWEAQWVEGQQREEHGLLTSDYGLMNLQRPSRLFASLVLQVAAGVTSPDGMYLCDKCGRPFSPQRRPHSNRACLCERDLCRKSRHSEVARNWKKEHDAEERRRKNSEIGKQ